MKIKAIKNAKNSAKLLNEFGKSFIRFLGFQLNESEYMCLAVYHKDVEKVKRRNKTLNKK